MPYLPQTQDEHRAEPCFTPSPNFMVLGLEVLVHGAGRADQRLCLMRHSRWENTFQVTQSDRKGGGTEGVSRLTASPSSALLRFHLCWSESRSLAGNAARVGFSKSLQTAFRQVLVPQRPAAPETEPSTQNQVSAKVTKPERK